MCVRARSFVGFRVRASRVARALDASVARYAVKMRESRNAVDIVRADCGRSASRTSVAALDRPQAIIAPALASLLIALASSCATFHAAARRQVRERTRSPSRDLDQRFDSNRRSGRGLR